MTRIFNRRKCLFCESEFGCTVMEDDQEHELFSCNLCSRGEHDCAKFNGQEMKGVTSAVCRKADCQRQLFRISCTDQHVGV